MSLLIFSRASKSQPLLLRRERQAALADGILRAHHDLTIGTGGPERMRDAIGDLVPGGPVLAVEAYIDCAAALRTNGLSHRIFEADRNATARARGHWWRRGAHLELGMLMRQQFEGRDACPLDGLRHGTVVLDADIGARDEGMILCLC